MRKIFKKLTIRTVISNFRQFLSVILIVFLASMLMSGFLMNYSTLNKCITTYFQKTNLADCWLDVSAISTEDEEFFKSLDIKYSKRLYIESSLKIADSSASNNGKIYIYDGRISNPYKENGAWGCVIDKTVAKNNNINVGYDSVEFVYEYDLNGTIYELNMAFLITGTMSLDECADFETAWPIFITEEFFTLSINSKISELNESGTLSERLPDLENIPYNQFLIVAKNSEGVEKNLDTVIGTIQDYYDGQSTNELLYTLKRENIESVVKLTSEIEQSKKMIYVFPVFFLIISVLIILTTIDQLVMQEKQKIGTLKSLGIPEKILFKHYSRFGAILCAIGSLLGVLFGCSIIPGIMFMKYSRVYSIPDDYIVSFMPLWWVGAVVLGFIILGYIVSMIACKKVLKKKAIECLKFQINNSSAFRSDKGLWLKNTPFPFRMAVRNIRLKPIRTFMAIVGIAGCVAMLLCGYGINDTLNKSVSYDFEKYFKYDISTTYTKDNFTDNLRDMEGLTNYETYEKLYVRADSETKTQNVNLYVVSDNSFVLRIKVSSGGCFVSRSVADELGLSEGDIVTISLGGVVREIPVTDIGTTAYFNAIYVCDDFGFDDFYKVKGVWINCGSSSPEKIEYINSINGTNTAKTMQESVESIKARVSTTTVMTEAIKFFAISLAVVVILNLIFLIVKERIREIATMKVLGKQLSSIVLSLFFEILFMSLIGLFIGSIFGYPMLNLVLSINKISSLNFIYNINFISFISSAFIVLSTIMIMMCLCFYKVKIIGMIESLKSSE